MKIIGFSSIDRTLLTYPAMEFIRLEGNLSIGVGKKSCIGRWEGRSYIPCDCTKAPVCQQCKMFNACAMCKGSCLKDEKTCLEEHVVYLAMFRPDILKIGVSKSLRFERRLIEQGADVGAVIASYPNGEIARKTEHKLQRNYGLKNSVRLSEKVNLEKELNLDVWETAREDFNAHNEIRLDYLNKNLWMRPLLLNDAIYGNVIGLKGRRLIVDDKNTLYVYDLNNLLGAQIISVATSHRQTSLHSF